MSESNSNSNATPEFEKPSGIEPVAKNPSNLKEPSLTEAFQVIQIYIKNEII
jgi:hypothetical protein